MEIGDLVKVKMTITLSISKPCRGWFVMETMFLIGNGWVSTKKYSFRKSRKDFTEIWRL